MPLRISFFISLLVYGVSPIINSFAKEPVKMTESCLKDLREVLVRQFQGRKEPKKKGEEIWTLEKIQKEFKNAKHAPNYLVGLCLDLPNPKSAIPFLKAALTHEFRFVALEAATVLALLGDRSGVPVFHEVLSAKFPLTNSAIEYFYAEGGLVLLGESLKPEHLKRQNALEGYVEKCLGKRSQK